MSNGAALFFFFALTICAYHFSVYLLMGLLAALVIVSNCFVVVVSLPIWCIHCSAVISFGICESLPIAKTEATARIYEYMLHCYTLCIHNPTNCHTLWSASHLQQNYMRHAHTSFVKRLRFFMLLSYMCSYLSALSAPTSAPAHQPHALHLPSVLAVAPKPQFINI